MPDHTHYNEYTFARDKLRNMSEEAKYGKTHRAFLSALAGTLRIELDREYHRKELPLIPELRLLAGVILDGVRTEKLIEPDLHQILNNLQQARDGLIQKLSGSAQTIEQAST